MLCDLSVGECRGGSTANSGWMYTGLLFSIHHRPDTDVLQLRICDSVDPVSGDCYIWSGKHLCTPRFVYYLPGGKCDDPFEDCGRDFCDKMFRVDFPKKKSEQSDKVSVYSFLIVPVFSIVYFYSICVFSGIYVQLYGMELVVFNIVLLLVMNGCMTYLLAKILKTNSLQNELNLANQKEEMQCRYYEEIEQKYQESRKIIHDMRNHLLVIEQLQSSGEEERAREYIGDVHQMLNMFGHKYYTDNRLLNIILNDKEKAANRASVTFDARIGAIALEGMKDSDLTTVFANLLDNAVEAAKESEQKQVVIRADSIHEFNVIRIENTMSLCQKKKEGHMGIGLENVTRVLKKYDGSFQRERMDGKYVCIVTMPKFPGMTEKAELNEKRKWI